jgi:hypothetical protein
VNIDCRGIWRPSKRKLIACTVKANDHGTCRNGAQSDESEQSIRLGLEEQNDRVWPTTFYDIDGTTKYVTFLSATKRGPVLLPKDRNPEYVYDLLLEEVTLS